MSNALMILAILLAPLVALQIQRRLDFRREIRERKLAIFRTLMTTRANKVSVSHVESLNMIDIEFFGDSDKERGPPKTSDAVLWRAMLRACQQAGHPSLRP